MRNLALCVLVSSLTACELLATPTGTDHPCAGNRTDTLWLDGEQTLYVGCGTTTIGTGLYRSGDLGGSWSAVDGFETFRSTHVHRASDGVLYVAGTDTAGDDRVRSLDGETGHSTVFASQGQTWNSFHAGSFARLPSGHAVAESLTGSDLAFRTEDSAAWQDGYDWSTDGSTHQILDMVVHGDTLVAVGSTIIEPPYVFVADTTDGFTMDSTALRENIGELWSVDSDGTGLIVGGADQAEDIGVVAWTSGDPSVASEWQVWLVDELVSGFTWVRGVCRSGDNLAATAEFPTSSTGLLLVSRDGGATWRDQTPEGAPSLSQCAWRGDELLITGAQGYFRAL